jgi:peptidoglycan/xylan/chitin deacetylase (PgdA/CDA1 family)
MPFLLLRIFVTSLAVAGSLSSSKSEGEPVTDPLDLARLQNRPWTRVHDAPVRGDTSAKKLALIFTGGDFSESTRAILDTLERRGVRASFFVTGSYVRNPENRALLARIIAQGHYLGPHSDGHLLYAPWEDRERSLVSEEEFTGDLMRNISDIRDLGANLGPVPYFIPPYEWYNRQQTAWAAKNGVLLFNFTPGSGSNRDWAPEGHKSFVPSRTILQDILAYEQRDPHGLNGFLLLLHLGSGRADPFHPLLDELLDELVHRGYAFCRVDQLLPVLDRD